MPAAKKSSKKSAKPGVVGKVVTGASDRVSGVFQGFFNTVGKVVSRTGKVAVGTVHVAKDILTLDGKNLKKDVKGIGRSTVGAVTNVAKGTVKTARSAVMGKEDNSSKHSTKKSTKKH
jgi:hypothetical protein